MALFLASARHRRRRPTRPPSPEVSAICSTIYANPSAPGGSHFAVRTARYKVGARHRLRSTGGATQNRKLPRKGAASFLPYSDHPPRWRNKRCRTDNAVIAFRRGQ
jgi:hypothetical protein